MRCAFECITACSTCWIYVIVHWDHAVKAGFVFIGAVAMNISDLALALPGPRIAEKYVDIPKHEVRIRLKEH
jgi:hypothetical protein